MARYIEEYATLSKEVMEEIERVYEGARVDVARLLGASTDEIALTRHVSEGINIVATGIDWEPGDEVIVTDEEHPARVAAVDEPHEAPGHRRATVSACAVRDGRDRGAASRSHHASNQAPLHEPRFDSHRLRPARPARCRRRPTSAACPCSWTGRTPSASYRSTSRSSAATSTQGAGTSGCWPRRGRASCTSTPTSWTTSR